MDRQLSNFGLEGAGETTVRSVGKVWGEMLSVLLHNVGSNSNGSCHGEEGGNDFTCLSRNAQGGSINEVYLITLLYSHDRTTQNPSHWEGVAEVHLIDGHNISCKFFQIFTPGAARPAAAPSANFQEAHSVLVTVIVLVVKRRDELEPNPSMLVDSALVLSKDEGVMDPLERAESVAVEVALPLQDTGTTATEVLVLAGSAICVCEAVPPEVADPGGVVDKKLVVASVTTEDIVSTKVLPDMVRVTRVVVVCGTSKTQPT